MDVTSSLAPGCISNDAPDESGSKGQTSMESTPRAAGASLYPDLAKDTPPQSAFMEIQDGPLLPFPVASAPPADASKKETQPVDPTQPVQSALQMFDPLEGSADSNRSATPELKPTEKDLQKADLRSQSTDMEVQEDPPPSRPLPPPPSARISAALPADSTREWTPPAEPRDTLQPCQPVCHPLSASTDLIHWATSDPEPREEREFRILIIGKTGNGKSSLCNTILGERRCAVGRGMRSTTADIQAETAEVLGKRLKVIDTPDISNLATEEATLRQHVTRWKDVTQSSPDVIILAVRCDIRYTKEEHDIYRQIQQLWGENSIFRQRLMVAFTFGDRQDSDLKDELKEVNEELMSVMREARERFVQVNNKLRDEREKAEQRERICGVIDAVIAQNKKPLRPPRPASGPQEKRGWALLVIGKTGHGKSSLANLILGEMFFEVGTGFCSVTKDAAARNDTFGDTTCMVIDTPDLKTIDQATIPQQISKWKTLARGCRVLFLLVVRCDVRFTSEDKDAFNDILKYWSENHPGMNYHVIVAFTYKDRLDYALKDHKENCKELKLVLQYAGNRWIEVDSRPQKLRGRGVNAQERGRALKSLWEHLRQQTSY